MAKSIKRNGFPLSAVAAALCFSVSGAYAAGMGKITVLSPLGQPLRAEIDVNASHEELAAMNARLASPEAFRQIGIDYAPAVSGIRFALEKRKNGQSYLRMFSDRPINDPFLDVLVELTWSSGRMVREYTLLLDPPEALAPVAPVPVAAPVTAKKPAVAQRPVTTPAAPAESAAARAPASSSDKVAPAKAPVQPAGTGKEAEGHLVKSGDTLTKIAAATKPDGVSLDQMLVALFRSNEDAFDGDNMNRMRAGKILSIPSAEAVAAVAPAEARQVIVAHSRDFNAYRGKLAASVAATPAKEETSKQRDQGKIAPKLAEKPADAEPATDKLKVSRTESAKDINNAKDAKAIQGRITALEEDLAVRDRALKEANSRVAELERNLADLKKLAELKSQAGAQAQAQAEAAKQPAAEPKPAMPEPAAVPVTPATTAPGEPPKAEEPPKTAETPVAPVVEAPKPAEPPVVDKPPVSVEAPPPVPAEEPSFIDENPALVYGGGGLLAIVLAYLGISALRRKSSGDEDVSTASRLSEGDLMANSVFGSTGGQAVDTSASIQTDFSQASLSAIDTDEGVDPVAEADVYMAYGRDAQAEEILVDALKTDPTRVAIYLKLLEIYAGHKNLAKFEKVATDLQGQVAGSGADWDKATAMGRAIDPGNPLYAGSAVAADQPLAEPVFVPEIAPPAAVEAAPVATTGLGDAVALPEAEDRKSGSDAGLGFDLDLGGASPDEVELASAEFDVSADAVADIQPAAGADFDIDLSLPEVDASHATRTPVSMDPVSLEPESAGGGLDFEFDLDAPHTDIPSSTVESAAEPAAEPAAIDFSGINLDLVTSSEPVSDTTVLPTELPAAEEGDNPDVTTKLELAQAYEEMGDREGARELLEEVLQEGSSNQQGIARAKLASLDA